MTTLASIPAGLVLQAGSHTAEEAARGELCVMELAAHLAGEPHADAPASACPVITTCLQVVNDWMVDPAARTALLLPYATRVVGTRGAPEVEWRRAYLLADWACREILPAALEAAGDPDGWAESVRAAAPIVDAATARAAWKRADEAAGAARTDHGRVAAQAAGDAAVAAALGNGAAAAKAAARAAVSAMPTSVASDQFLDDHVPVILDRLLAVFFDDEVNI